MPYWIACVERASIHGGQTASSVGMADGDRLDVEDAVAATEPED